MIGFAESIKIHASPSVVFEFITNMEKFEKVKPKNMDVKTHGGHILTLGTKMTWTINREDGTSHSWDEEITKMEDGVTFEWEMVEAPEKFKGGWRLYEIHNGTLLILWDEMAQQQNPSGKDKELTRRLQQIKLLIEEK
ncbi:MAG: SRPBCC family protein [Candidatus Ranarchaeia archaeon]